VSTLDPVSHRTQNQTSVAFHSFHSVHLASNLPGSIWIRRNCQDLETVSKSASIKDLQLSGYPRYNLAPTARKNSAYRSGCHKFLFSITYRTPDPVVTPV
jgi:hypothetical protein